MLSEGRRDGLRLALSRSLSEPGVLTPPTARLLAPPPAPTSLPASPCADSASLQRSLLLRRARAMEPVELARRLTRAQKVRSFLLVDVRSFVAYNVRHVRSAINVNCADRINRRRLLQRKVALVDLAGSPAGRDVLRKRCFREVVVYDEASRDLEGLPPHHPVLLVLLALLEDNRDPVLLKGDLGVGVSGGEGGGDGLEDTRRRRRARSWGVEGEGPFSGTKLLDEELEWGGFQAFEAAYSELCEDALMRSKSGAESPEPSADSCYPPGGDQQDGVGGPETAIESAPVVQVLPFLYLGNAKDAADARVLEAHGIRRVLNVTSHTPSPPDGRLRKSLPAHDSAHQNLRQYFDEAIDYIEEGRRVGERVLVHCQAGVSRSPTIVLAYLMKHARLTMLEAYKLVKARRPVISPNLNFMGQLVEWEATLQGEATAAECQPCHQCQWQKQEANKVPSACHV